MVTEKQFLAYEKLYQSPTRTFHIGEVKTVARVLSFTVDKVYEIQGNYQRLCKQHLERR